MIIELIIAVGIVGVAVWASVGMTQRIPTRIDGIEQAVEIPDLPQNHTPPCTPTPTIEPPVEPERKPPTTICGVAKSLCWYGPDRELNTLLTTKEIERWILDNIEYEYHYHPRGVELTWTTRKGDCTDWAMLAKQMLSCLDIDSEYRHGFAGGSEGKHDWLRTDEYTLFIQGYPGGCKDIGAGFW